MIISILTDNLKSWFIPYGKLLEQLLQDSGNKVKYVFSKKDIPYGDICFLLSCSRIIENEYLKRNRLNIVVHASDLPRGKGFSPVQWQILEGKDEIPLTLFEAVEEVDAGPFYFKETLKLAGNELFIEIRDLLGNKIIEMCQRFIKEHETLTSKEQIGEETFYRKRTIKDDEIDINLSILEQFQHFRIADNEVFPLWFKHRNKRYILKIFSE